MAFRGTWRKTYHDSKSIRTDLPQQRFLLSPADRMLSGTGAFHLQGPLDHVLHASLHLGPFLGVPSVVDDALMEVTVTNVAEDTGKQAKVVHLLLAHFDNIGKSAEGNGNIGTPWKLVSNRRERSVGRPS
jgi:hypothetical protein